MNRRQRRAYRAELRQAYSKRTEYTVLPSLNEGVMILNSGATIPADIKADIGRVVSAISFRNIEGGDCHMRAAIGYRVLKQLGWQPQLCIGGLVFRAGPHPVRDVVACCRPDNYGTLINGEFFGHVWLELDGDAVDFTGCEWRRQHGAPKDGHGPIQWQCEPPSLIWAPQDLFDWQPGGTPELGKVWFCPWRGELPKFATDYVRFTDTAAVFATTLEQNMARMCLMQRVRDLCQAPEQYADKWRHRMRSTST